MESRFPLRMAYGHGLDLVRRSVPIQFVRWYNRFTGSSLPCQHETSQTRSQIISESFMTTNCRRLQRIQICRKYRTMLLPHSLRHDCGASYYGTLPTIAGLREALRFGRSFLFRFCGSDHNRETFVVRVRQGHNGECRNFSHFTCILCAFSWHICYMSFCIYLHYRSRLRSKTECCDSS